MSEIPFVQALGDALERTAAAQTAQPRSRLRRRLTAAALAIATLAGGTATAAGVFSGHEERLATTSVYCYDGPSLDAGATGLSAGDRSPVEACKAALHTRGPLTACAASDHVAVLPGGPGVCMRAGLAPLPIRYADAHARFRALARDIEALEHSAGCLPPAQFAQRVQALLDRSGWAGWRTKIRSDVSEGPCGTVSSLNGDGSTNIEPAVDPDDRVIFIFGRR